MSVSTMAWLGTTATATAMGAVAHGCFWPRSQVFGRVLHRGPAGEARRIALTFDDGPHPEATRAVLALLARHGARATFFVIGRHVERWPEVVREIHAAGHGLGNHSFDHAHTGMFGGAGYWRRQLGDTSAAIGAAAGTAVRWFRPPMGFKQPLMMAAARRSGLEVVTWTRRARDGVRTTANRIVARLGERVSGGEIVTLHDGVEPGGVREAAVTIAALERLLVRWRERELELVTLDELMSR